MPNVEFLAPPVITLACSLFGQNQGLLFRVLIAMANLVEWHAPSPRWQDYRNAWLVMGCQRHLSWQFPQPCHHCCELQEYHDCTHHCTGNDVLSPCVPESLADQASNSLCPIMNLCLNCSRRQSPEWPGAIWWSQHTTPVCITFITVRYVTGTNPSIQRKTLADHGDSNPMVSTYCGGKLPYTGNPIHIPTSRGRWLASVTPTLPGILGTFHHDSQHIYGTFTTRRRPNPHGQRSQSQLHR